MEILNFKDKMLEYNVCQKAFARVQLILDDPDLDISYFRYSPDSGEVLIEVEKLDEHYSVVYSQAYQMAKEDYE